MIYLDYSATTPVSRDVLNSYITCCSEYIGNPNSLHKLGLSSKNIIDASTNQIKNILNLKDHEVIYTSGATESNNTVIKSIYSTYKNRGNKILTTNYEHSSIYKPLEYLEKKGIIIEYIKTDDNGLIDLDDLEKKLDDNVILVTISSTNSELGITQNINEIGKIIKKHSKTYFHVDMTQSIGKIKINFDYVDFASFSAHKFYGMKGIGCLIKRKNIVIEPLIHGGDSTTRYRAGTPCVGLIVSLAKALRLSYEDIDEKYNHVLNINKIIVDGLKKYKNVIINSNDKCIPHILNISVLNIKPETFMHALEKYDIYISTKSACSSNDTISRAVLELTKNQKRAKHSLRISISYLTSNDEAKKFLEYFDICYNSLNLNE